MFLPPLLLPSSGWCYHNNTKVQLWLTESPAQLTTFVLLYCCDNNITLKMAAAVAVETCCWEYSEWNVSPNLQRVLLVIFILWHVMKIRCSQNARDRLSIRAELIWRYSAIVSGEMRGLHYVLPPTLLTGLLNYLLTPRCTVLLEQLTGLQPVKKFPAFHRTQRFITALTTVRHLSLSWASPIQSIYPHHTSCRSVLVNKFSRLKCSRDRC